MGVSVYVKNQRDAGDKDSKSKRQKRKGSKKKSKRDSEIVKRRGRMLERRRRRGEKLAWRGKREDLRGRNHLGESKDDSVRSAKKEKRKKKGPGRENQGFYDGRGKRGRSNQRVNRRNKVAQKELSQRAKGTGERPLINRVERIRWNWRRREVLRKEVRGETTRLLRRESETGGNRSYYLEHVVETEKRSRRGEGRVF